MLTYWCARNFGATARFRMNTIRISSKGFASFSPDGTRIDNFPEQHHDNCMDKHQGTYRLFKPTVRVYKNFRNKLIEEQLLAEGVAPSYFLEGTLYNVPLDRFGGTHSANFIDTLNWIIEAERNKFVCANEQSICSGKNNPVTWAAAKCNTFLSAAVQYWDA